MLSNSKNTHKEIPMFTDEEKGWLDKCKAEPNRYQLAVDNDHIGVDAPDDNGDLENVFSFNDYGQYFIVNLLNYIGCYADHV